MGRIRWGWGAGGMIPRRTTEEQMRKKCAEKRWNRASDTHSTHGEITFAVASLKRQIYRICLSLLCVWAFYHARRIFKASAVNSSYCCLPTANTRSVSPSSSHFLFSPSRREERLASCILFLPLHSYSGRAFFVFPRPTILRVRRKICVSARKKDRREKWKRNGRRISFIFSLRSVRHTLRAWKWWIQLYTYLLCPECHGGK